MAARRVARQANLPIKYLMADARHLPFPNSSIDVVFSYSVLQHLSKKDVFETLTAVRRVLRIGGTSLIQMPNFFGIGSLQHQFKRGFREARDFEVRYWSMPEPKRTFEGMIGLTNIYIDCFGGIGLQRSDLAYMREKVKWVIILSQILKKLVESLRVLGISLIAYS